MFDFIEAAEFRQSLELDYGEMHRCAKASAWKSVQVLAGSIVEALLIDYLLATHKRRPGAQDPLRIDLSEAIALCKTDGLLNDRTADLSTVVRSYRNLIHPGRVIRLGEEAPSENSAVIAMKLVDMITAQVESRRKETFGLTADQLLSKLERDDDSIAILKHLLADVNAGQRSRFLLDVVPPRYLELKQQGSPDDELFSPLAMKLDRLPRAYRLVLDSVDEPTKRRVADWFVRIIREEDGDTVRLLREAFFRSEDTAMVADKQRALVKEHLLAAAPYKHTIHTADMMSGLASFLEKAEVRPWLDPYVKLLTASTSGDWERNSVRKAFLRGVATAPSAIEKAIDSRLDSWVAHFAGRNQEKEAQYIRDLKAEVESARLPF